jgi:hypothetical protein
MATEAYEVMQIDVWGPASLVSHRGNRYLLTITDDYTPRAFTVLHESESDSSYCSQAHLSISKNISGPGKSPIKKQLAMLLEKTGKEAQKCARGGLGKLSWDESRPRQVGSGERLRPRGLGLGGLV